MTGGQLGLLDGEVAPPPGSTTGQPPGPRQPRLTPPADLDPKVAWHSCGPAALAAVCRWSLTAIRPRLPHERGYMSPADMKIALERCGLDVVEKPHAWPSFGLAMIMFDGPWMTPGLPSGAAMRGAHWIAVDRFENIGGGEIYDVNYQRPVFFEAWMRYAIDLARELDKKATGGWSVRVGFEITSRT